MNGILNVYREICKLKNLVRSGWIQRKVNAQRLESVAEHCFSMGILALLIAKQENLQLNMEKVYSMILAHELGEIDVGDITPLDNVPLDEKYEKELQGVKRISSLLTNDYLLNLWMEFEENKTPEAQFVKKIDKLDAVMQSKIYSEQNNSKVLFEEFLNNALDKIDSYAEIFNT